MMNRQAQAWGLKNTQFKNVTGLTEAGHYSSARDIAHRSRRTSSRDYPEYYPLLLDQANTPTTTSSRTTATCCSAATRPSTA